jgi:hypothetical protein
VILGNNRDVSVVIRGGNHGCSCSAALVSDVRRRRGGGGWSLSLFRRRTKFSIGYCISAQTNDSGGAVRADECSSRCALKIEKLAAGGQRPDCGTGMRMEKGPLASYVHDLQTDPTAGF